MMSPLSNKDKKKLLRHAVAKELKPGGVWYYRQDDGEFKTVISDMDHLGMTKENYRTICKYASKYGYMYLNREKPNYSLSPEMHKTDFERMKKYETKS